MPLLVEGPVAVCAAVCMLSSVGHLLCRCVAVAQLRMVGLLSIHALFWVMQITALLYCQLARPGQWRGHAWHARISHAQRAHHLKTGVCPMCLFRHSCCPAWATKLLCKRSVCVDCTRLCWHSFYFHASSAAQWVRLSFYGVTLWLSFGRRRSLPF